MNRVGTPVARLACVAMTLLSWGCQSHQPLPVDVQAHRAAWEARDLNEGTLQAAIDALLAQASQHPEPFRPADGLSLREAQAVALVLNPDLRVLRLQADVPLAGAKHAGKWDDPELSFDALRILAGVSRPWIIGGGIGLTLPLSGRLDAQRDLAWAEHDAAAQEVLAAQWQLGIDLHRAWLEWSASQRRVELLADHLAALRPVEAQAGKLVELGEMPSTDGRVLAMERARQEALWQQACHQARQHRQAALALVGLTPEAPITLLPITLTPSDEALPDPVTARPLLERHPRLAIALARHETAERRLQLEIRKQYPDLTLGPIAEREEGQSRIGLGLSLPVPVWNRNQSGIAQAVAARQVTHVQAQTLFEKLSHELMAHHDRWQAARSHRQAVERHVLPAVDVQLEQMAKLLALGELDIRLWHDALARQLDARQALLQSTLEEMQARAAFNAMIALKPAAVSTDSLSSQASEAVGASGAVAP